jgi:purine-binding chemotaxis protein CheW
MSPTNQSIDGVPASPGEPVQLCGFYVGSKEYVVDVKRVEEILHSQTVSRLPEASLLIEGALCIRGATVPVIDLRKHLHLGWPPKNSNPKCLICRVGRDRVALLVDEVSEVVQVKKEEIRPLPAGMANGVVYVLGMCGPPQKPKLLFDLKALLQTNPTPGGELR